MGGKIISDGRPNREGPPHTGRQCAIGGQGGAREPASSMATVASPHRALWRLPFTRAPRPRTPPRLSWPTVWCWDIPILCPSVPRLCRCGLWRQSRAISSSNEPTPIGQSGNGTWAGFKRCTKCASKKNTNSPDRIAANGERRKATKRRGTMKPLVCRSGCIARQHGR